MRYSKKRGYLLIILLVIIIISALKYAYPFFTEEERDLIYNNLVALKKSDSVEDFSFAVIGDNKNSISTFQKIITSIDNDPSIKFVINTGDMVFDGSPVKYNFFLKQIKKFRVPLLVVPGNHDVADHGTENYIEIFGPLYYSFHFGKAYFIILNNSNEERIDSYQMWWLREELEKSKAYKYRFLFMHVPIYDPRFKHEQQPGHSMKDLKNAKELLSLIEKYNVTMVFAGHIHGYFKGNWGKVPYIITAGAGAELFGTNPKHYFYHYIKVNVSDKGVNYELVKMKSPDFNIIDRIGAFLWLYLYSYIVINYWAILLVISLFFLLSLIVYGEEKRLFIKIGNYLLNMRIVRFLIKLSKKIGNLGRE